MRRTASVSWAAVSLGVLALLSATACAPEPSPVVPPEIAITSSNPTSPAPDLEPELIGIAPSGTTVRIFASTDCTGPTVAAGAASQFTSTGLSVFVLFASTATFSAIASGPSGLTSCSAPFTFTNTLLRELEPNGTVSTETVLPVTPGTPTHVWGQIDGPPGGPYASDLFLFDVADGQSIRVELFDESGTGCVGLDTQITIVNVGPPVDIGGNDDNDGIGSCSLIDPAVDVWANGVHADTYRLQVRGTTTGATYRVRIDVLP